MTDSITSYGAVWQYFDLRNEDNVCKPRKINLACNHMTREMPNKQMHKPGVPELVVLALQM